MFPVFLSKTGPSQNPFAVVDQLFEGLAARPERSALCRTLPVDVYELDKKLVVEAEVPGLTEDEIDIEVFDGELTIRAGRKVVQAETTDPASDGDSAPAQERNYLRREREEKMVQRTLRLPFDVLEDAIEAVLSNGVLRLVLPKAPSAEPRRIAVKLND